MEAEAAPEEEKPLWLRDFNTVVEWKKKYKLRNDEWRFDPIPEIIEGHNIADFIDPEILAKLEELEREEEERAANEEDEMEEDDEDDIELTEEQMDMVKKIREKKKLIVQQHRIEKAKNFSTVPRSKRDGELPMFESHLAEMGIDPSAAVDRARERSTSRVARKRSRSESVSAAMAELDSEDGLKRKRTASMSKSPAPGSGLRDLKQKLAAEKLSKIVQRAMQKDARKGESDRKIVDLKPKHLYAGKRGSGTTDRR